MAPRSEIRDAHGNEVEDDDIFVLIYEEDGRRLSEVGTSVQWDDRGKYGHYISMLTPIETRGKGGEITGWQRHNVRRFLWFSDGSARRLKFISLVRYPEHIARTAPGGGPMSESERPVLSVVTVYGGDETPRPWGNGRWWASLVVDGRRTTFDCTHLHHSKEAVDKCHTRLLRTAKTYVNSPTFRSATIDAARYEIVEWSYDRGPRSRVLRRFTWADETARDTMVCS